MTMLERSWLWTSAITSVLAVVVMGLTGRAAAAENRAAEPVSKRTAVSGEQSGGSASSQPDKRIRRDYGFYEPEPLDFDDHQGYVQIFDGVSLKSWDGDPNTWHVEDGAIVGESTKEKPVANSYISFHGIAARDFDLKFEIRVENGGGSGIQYRSQVGLPGGRQPPPGQTIPELKGMMTGPQAGFVFPGEPRQTGGTGAVSWGKRTLA